ncbi:hypothetical protein VTN00DRAFT_1036 [Thermoascus crustaceus]|uniref:uncharacterized protein n=1 Tax=Thermoascus crustaceus TaxID=5088 RepID=UPI003742E934
MNTSLSILDITESTTETMELTAQNPLSEFVKLNDQIYLYEPGKHPPHRCLVIICAWLFAAPRHIAKYTRLSPP